MSITQTNWTKVSLTIKLTNPFLILLVLGKKLSLKERNTKEMEIGREGLIERGIDREREW